MIRLSVATTLIATAANIVPAQAITDGDFKEMAAKVFLPVIEEYDIPGLAIGLTLNGKEFYFTHGEAVRQTHMPVTTETIFELGSISKLFNVSLAELAEQRGLL